MDKERELAKKLLTALEGDPDVLTYLQVSYFSWCHGKIQFLLLLLCFQYVPKKTFNTEYDVDNLLKAVANNFTQQTGKNTCI